MVTNNVPARSFGAALAATEGLEVAAKAASYSDSLLLKEGVFLFHRPLQARNPSTFRYGVYIKS